MKYILKDNKEQEKEYKKIKIKIYVCVFVTEGQKSLLVFSLSPNIWKHSISGPLP